MIHILEFCFKDLIAYMKYKNAVDCEKWVIVWLAAAGARS